MEKKQKAYHRQTNTQDSEDQKNNPPHNAGATTDERSEYPVFLHLEKGNPTLAESQTTRQSTTNDSRNESVLTEVENEAAPPRLQEDTGIDSNAYTTNSAVELTSLNHLFDVYENPGALVDELSELRVHIHSLEDIVVEQTAKLQAKDKSIEILTKRLAKMEAKLEKGDTELKKTHSLLEYVIHRLQDTTSELLRNKIDEDLARWARVTILRAKTFILCIRCRGLWATSFDPRRVIELAAEDEEAYEPPAEVPKARGIQPSEYQNFNIISEDRTAIAKAQAEQAAEQSGLRRRKKRKRASDTETESH